MNNYDRIEKVIRYIDRHYQEQPSLAELAGVAGVSEYHFQRLFTQWAGTTPKKFLQSLTAAHAKDLLVRSRDVLSAALDSGLSGPSRLHDLMISVEAVTPGEFKSKGAGIVISYGFHQTPFGRALVGITSRGVCHVSFASAGSNERPSSSADTSPHTRARVDSELLDELKQKWTNATFRRDQRGTGSVADSLFTARRQGRESRSHALHKHGILAMGTPFQIKVWEALIQIPPGQVLAYSDVAQAIGSPQASRAVGSALAANSVAVLIPCHRVIRETGHFGQYRWGVERKKALLAWESS